MLATKKVRLNLLPDLRLVCTDGCVSAHAAWLAKRSSVWRSAFEKDCKTSEFKMDYTKKVVTAMVNWIEMHKIADNLSLQENVGLIKLAHEYDMQALIDDHKFVSGAESAHIIGNLGFEFKNKELKRQAEDWLSDHPKESLSLACSFPKSECIAHYLVQKSKVEETWEIITVMMSYCGGRDLFVFVVNHAMVKVQGEMVMRDFMKRYWRYVRHLIPAKSLLEWKEYTDKCDDMTEHSETCRSCIGTTIKRLELARAREALHGLSVRRLYEHRALELY